MKKIIINGRFLLHRITGVERYAHEICNELDKISEPHEYILAIPPNVVKVPNYKNIDIVQVGSLHDILWEHISFPRYVSKMNAISLNLCNVAPLINPGIVCIHDVKIKAKPEYFSRKFLIWYNILFKNETKRAKHIITVSNFSKKEIIKYYHVNENKISVISNGWQHFDRVKFDANALNKFNLEKDSYFFSMCSLEPNKNFKWIAEVAKRYMNEKFVVAGSINKKVFSDGLGFECPSNLKLIGYISDEEAKTLMKNCKAFLFNTFYEGFGIPPLEALSSGCKRIVVSDSEVMHEIFDSSVCYIDPKSYSVNLKNILEIQDKKRDAILAKYSWKLASRELKRYLDEVSK